MRWELRHLSADLAPTRFDKVNNNLSFHHKSWTPFTSFELRNKNSQAKSQFVACMSVQQARRSKVAIKTLELEDAKEPPLNLYKPKQSYIAIIISIERIVGPTAPGETCHIVIDHGGNVPCWEGQSYGIIPPRENPKKPGVPQNVRLYSIASTRYGDSFDGKTCSLCSC